MYTGGARHVEYPEVLLRRRPHLATNHLILLYVMSLFERNRCKEKDYASLMKIKSCATVLRIRRLHRKSLIIPSLLRQGAGWWVSCPIVNMIIVENCA